MSFSNLGLEEVKKYLPHRAPFLMVDRILEIQVPEGSKREPKELVGTRSIGIKTISANEWFFEGHFPSFAIFPGVLIAEAMAQTASFCIYPSVAEAPEEFSQKHRFLLAGLDGIRFKRPVFPGDTLRIEAEFKRVKANVCLFEARALVDGNRVAQGDLLANMLPIEKTRGS